MIRRSTVVYITILLALAAVYYYLSNRAQPADILVTPEAVEEIEYLFTADDGVPSSILIRSKTGESVEVTRNADNAWALTQPVEAEAEQGASEAAASQLTTMRILERISEIDAEVVGLDEPAYLLTVKFNSGTERTIQIGVVTPTESGFYIRDASGGDILIVSKSAVDSLLRLLTSPPYLETPLPAVTEAGTPAAETPTP
ncbi:MAG TPA: DUF4340 domain-containing protein [Anaerolineales bacterium]|nr:DUF4340 domain-containing protein [Anaerolineales bacterium]